MNSNTEYKVSSVDATRYGMVLPAPHCAALPNEIWGEVASYLPPEDFISLTSSCLRFHGLRTSQQVTKDVLQNSRLSISLPRAHNFNAHQMRLSEIVGEYRLVQRLEKGPIIRSLDVPRSMYHQAAELSPNSLHVKVDSYDYTFGEWGDQGPRIQIIRKCEIFPIDGSSQPPLVFNPSGSEFSAEFSPSGSNLIVFETQSGPVKLFDLSVYKKLAKTIAPATTYSYGDILTLFDQNSFMFSCSDRYVRTFACDGDGIFSQIDEFYAGVDGAICGISQDQNTILLRDGMDIGLYKKEINNTLKLLEELPMPCCGELFVSSRARFITTFSECRWDSMLYAVDVSNGLPNVTELGDVNMIAVSPDDTQVAVSEGTSGYTMLSWPELEDVSGGALPLTAAPLWLRDHMAQTERKFNIELKLIDDSNSVSITKKA
jgi:hypothetical protein